MTEMKATNPRRIEELTKEELARRELPDGGKLIPVNHIVRIVVVPDSRPQGNVDRELPERKLGDAELAAAEIELKKMPPPQSQAPGNATSPAANNMFDLLEPTDIVVIRQQPASVRTVDEKEKPVSAEVAQQSPRGLTRKLFAHSHEHTDTVLRVWTESDTIEYQCDEPFTIVEMKRAGWKLHGTPEDPFTNTKPWEAKKRDRAQGEKDLWVWTSSPLPASANNQQYKMTFEIDSRKIDPDVVCGNPPPL